MADCIRAASTGIYPSRSGLATGHPFLARQQRHYSVTASPIKSWRTVVSSVLRRWR